MIMTGGAEEGIRAPLDLRACCEISYGHPLIRWFLGESLHPGGLNLTTRLANVAGIGSSATVLDVGSGSGASAVHLAKTLGCRVAGVTLEREGVLAGYELAKSGNVEDLVHFVQGPIQQFQMTPRSFDFAIMECVLSLIESKGEALSHLFGLLRPGGRLALSDVTVNGPLPPELRGISATVGCIGGALSLDDYAALLEEQGFDVVYRENRRGALSSLLRDIRRKLWIADVARRLGRLRVGGELLAEGKRLLTSAQAQVRKGVLEYGLLVARKPV